jgi:HK97 family phage major capsid protein
MFKKITALMALVLAMTLPMIANAATAVQSVAYSVGEHIANLTFNYMAAVGFILFDSNTEIKELVENGLKKVQDEFTSARTELEASMKKYESQLEEKGKVDAETKAEVKTLSEKFAEINTTLTAMGQKIAEGFKSEGSVILTAGAEFIKSDKFKQFVESKGEMRNIRMEVKNTVTGDSNTVFPQQQQGVISGNFAPLTVRGVLTAIPVSTNQVNSLREATWNNSAAGVAQGATKPESDITFEPYNVSIETIAHWIKVSNQLLADAPAIAAYIDSRLRDGLNQEVERQLVNGSGITPNLSGFTDSGNYTAYSATSDDLLVDAINRAKYAQWAATGQMPDTVFVNPADWGAMERTREGAGSGMFLYGLPGMAGGMNPFGVQVVLTNNVTAGKFIIGAMRQAAVLYVRQGATVEMGYDGNDFTKNLVTIRAEERLGLGVERPSLIYYGSFTA